MPPDPPAESVAGCVTGHLYNALDHQGGATPKDELDLWPGYTPNRFLSADSLTEAIKALDAVFASGIPSGVQRFTSGSGTYTPGAGVKSIVVLLVGGGGGGGAVTGASGQTAAGGGGGAGATLLKRLTSGFANASYAVGAAGAGGSAGNNPGSNGGQTTFQLSGGGTTYSAPGGNGGQPMTAGTTAAFAQGGISNLATNGDENGQGEPGGFGIRLTGAEAHSGNGGSTYRGGGGKGQNLQGAASGSSYGAGGAGGMSDGIVGGGTAAAGGDGAAGVVIIWEFP